MVWPLLNNWSNKMYKKGVAQLREVKGTQLKNTIWGCGFNPKINKVTIIKCQCSTLIHVLISILLESILFQNIIFLYLLRKYFFSMLDHHPSSICTSFQMIFFECTEWNSVYFLHMNLIFRTKKFEFSLNLKRIIQKNLISFSVFRIERKIFRKEFLALFIVKSKSKIFQCL